jgi:hypothetical protein
MIETSKLESVAEKYRQRGYRIEFRPDVSGLPKEAKALQPDFVASKGDEHIIVEVKHSQNLIAYPALTRLAESIRSIPGWRLDVVVLEEPKAVSEPEPLSIENAKRRLEAADHVANETADYAGALLLVWTAVEAVLRDHLSPHIEGVPTSTSRLPKLAYSMGVIGTQDFATAEWMTKIRNDVVHGSSEVVVSLADYEKARDFASRLLAADCENELVAS